MAHCQELAFVLIMNKICSICNEEKDISLFRIARSQCLLCFGATRKKYAEAHREEIKVRMRDWKAANPEKVAINAHNYYKKNSERIDMRQREYEERRKLDPKFDRICEHCGTAFSYKDKSARFCSTRCFAKSRPMEKHPQWGGGKTKTRRGYIHVRMGNDTRQYEHRAIAERILGRKLSFNEVVHHVNGDKSDNRNCNLLICGRGYHKWLHDRMSYLYQREHFKDTL